MSSGSKATNKVPEMNTTITDQFLFCFSRMFPAHFSGVCGSKNKDVTVCIGAFWRFRGLPGPSVLETLQIVQFSAQIFEQLFIQSRVWALLGLYKYMGKNPALGSVRV